MAVEIVTKEDLQAFRLQVMSEIRQLFLAAGEKTPKQWLRNSDVRKLLKVSANTVQRLRVSGKLKSSKIGGIHFYRMEDIQQLLESGTENQRLCG